MITIKQLSIWATALTMASASAAWAAKKEGGPAPKTKVPARGLHRPAKAESTPSLASARAHRPGIKRGTRQ